MMLGAGRAKISDSIDHSVGIVLHKKVGDKVAPNDNIATIYSNKEDISSVRDTILSAYSFSTEQIIPKLIIKVVK